MEAPTQEAFTPQEEFGNATDHGLHTRVQARYKYWKQIGYKYRTPLAPIVHHWLVRSNKPAQCDLLLVNAVNMPSTPG
eukprot:988349-Amphidinium_carterae.1